MVVKKYIFRKAGPLIRQTNGPPPTRGSLNMEVSNMMMMLKVVMFMIRKVNVLIMMVFTFCQQNLFHF